MKTISVCIGSACHVTGSNKVIQALKKMIDERGLKDEVELMGSFCMGKCTEGVSVKYNDIIYSVSVDNIEETFLKIMKGD